MPIAETRTTPFKQAILVGLGLMLTLGVIYYVLTSISGSTDNSVSIELATSEVSLGNAKEQAELIKKQGPTFWPDLRSGDKAIYLNHIGDDTATGWYAISAFVPGKQNCLIKLTEDKKFKDCDDKSYNEKGDGLKHYQIKVKENNLIVDID